MTLDIILITLGAILMIVGIVGSVLPVLPGVILSYMGIVLIHFSSLVEFSTSFLITWAVIIIIVEFLDYYVPIWGTKRFGGGKKGTWGCMLGIVASVFVFPPWGIIIFPFLGAIVGELLDKKTASVALKAGFGAFMGFLAGTLVQLVVSVILAFYFFKEIFAIWFT